MSTDIRLAHLRSYIAALAADLAAQGKFAAKGENKIEAAVNAALAGGSAMAVQLAVDLKTIGGQGLAMVQPLAESFIGSLAADVARAGAKRAGAALADLFSAPKVQAKAEQRRAGRALMETAKKMGGR